LKRSSWIVLAFPLITHDEELWRVFDRPAAAEREVDQDR